MKIFWGFLLRRQFLQQFFWQKKDLMAIFNSKKNPVGLKSKNIIGTAGVNRANVFNFMIYWNTTSYTL